MQQLSDPFWSLLNKGGHVTRPELGPCWEYETERRGYCSGGAEYPQITRNGRRQGVHRIAWSLANGRDIPDKMVVMHRCDNPPCCNPHHLELGTTRENIVDAVKKGRLAPPKTIVQKGQCKRGHPATEENLYRWRGGSRCRACVMIWRQRMEERKRTQ